MLCITLKKKPWMQAKSTYIITDMLYTNDIICFHPGDDNYK